MASCSARKPCRRNRRKHWHEGSTRLGDEHSEGVDKNSVHRSDPAFGIEPDAVPPNALMLKLSAELAALKAEPLMLRRVAGLISLPKQTYTRALHWWAQAAGEHASI